MLKSKMDYFVKLNEKNITDNKIFYNTIKPFFPKKINILKE